jgi:pyridoxamine 5'-phosphate oxidase
MSDDKRKFWTETLPDALPSNPLEVAAQWLAQASSDAAQPNPNAMVLASADARGQPSARVVLCKGIEVASGCILFYTNYRSRKGNELQYNPRAAAVFHWDHVHRQVRIEGLVEVMSNADNDAYFETRAWQSRLGAWASQQSQPLASHDDLKAAVAEQAQRFGIPYEGPGAPEPDNVVVHVPRPPNWGGFRLRAEAVELWVEGAFRIHDRARWTRTLPAGFWSATRLQP